MHRCLQLAQLGEEFVAPNPMVGCVIVFEGKIVAEGYHKKHGGPHAEVNALNILPTGITISECDVYVSLEPCSHFGKTPPCADLIIAKRPKNLFVGMLDPNPKVAGTGVEKIRKAGVNVSIGILELQCAELNKKFVSFFKQKQPFITLKWAQTADNYMGRLLDSRDLPRQISNKENSVFVHKLRATHTAIMVGANTVNNDNPLLDLRFWKGRNPTKVIVSKSLSVDLDSKVFKSGKCLILNGLKDGKGTNLEFVKLNDFTAKGILRALYKLGIQSVLIEGGPTLLNLFIRENVWNEVIIISSKTTWLSGVSAPVLNAIPTSTEVKFGDTINYYKN
jgi:diaminohydroxyphosphoribosylaminopyrimidine deaminase/5-amino-6-(5-phosphoribosylamino)uracil reductase